MVERVIDPAVRFAKLIEEAAGVGRGRVRGQGAGIWHGRAREHEALAVEADQR